MNRARSALLMSGLPRRFSRRQRRVDVGAVDVAEFEPAFAFAQFAEDLGLLLSRELGAEAIGPTPRVGADPRGPPAGAARDAVQKVSQFLECRVPAAQIAAAPRRVPGVRRLPRARRARRSVLQIAQPR